MRAMGHISTMTAVGQLIGMGLSGWIADRWNWSHVFWTGTIIGLAGMAAALFVKEASSANSSRIPIQLKDLSSVIRVPVLLKVAILSVLGHSILFITTFGFTPSQAVSLGASKSDLSLLVFAFMIPHAIAAFITGRRIVPRIGAWNAVIAGFAASSICTVAIALMPTFELLAATQALNGFAQGMYFSMLLGLAIQYVDFEKRATAIGFYQAVYSVGMFGGPFFAGWINQAAWPAASIWEGFWVWLPQCSPPTGAAVCLAKPCNLSEFFEKSSFSENIMNSGEVRE